jgi:hypothetical protein
MLSFAVLVCVFPSFLHLGYVDKQEDEKP